MRLALQTDYALRTLIYLAGRPGRAHVSDVADFFQISAHHVAKVVNLLARQGYVRSVRGIGGGIELARLPHEIRLGQVVLDFEGNMHLLECVGTSNVCVIQPNCRLRGVLFDAERLLIEYLNRYCLSDLMSPGQPLVELLSPEVRLPEGTAGRSSTRRAKQAARALPARRKVQKKSSSR